MPVDTPDQKTETEILTDTDNLWQVVLLDDDDHTYDYVIEMLMELFGHPVELAYQMACDVDKDKRVIVDVDTKEKAQVGCDRIKAYGPDWRMKRSKGSMSSVIEPVV
jgi:ATP-dependent Clp protease adaptor protein ClpS